MRFPASWSGFANPMAVCNCYTPYWGTLEDNDMAKRVYVMLDDDLWRVI